MNTNSNKIQQMKLMILADESFNIEDTPLSNIPYLDTSSLKETILSEINESEEYNQGGVVNIPASYEDRMGPTATKTGKEQSFNVQYDKNGILTPESKQQIAEFYGYKNPTFLQMDSNINLDRPNLSKASTQSLVNLASVTAAAKEKGMTLKEYVESQIKGPLNEKMVNYMFGLPLGMLVNWGIKESEKAELTKALTDRINTEGDEVWSTVEKPNQFSSMDEIWSRIDQEKAEEAEEAEELDFQPASRFAEDTGKRSTWSPPPFTPKQEADWRATLYDSPQRAAELAEMNRENAAAGIREQEAFMADINRRNARNTLNNMLEDTLQDFSLNAYEREEQAMASDPTTDDYDPTVSTPANLSAPAPATPSIAGTFEGDASAVTPSAAPTFLGLPIEYSYPGEDRSSRANFSSQDAEGYSGEGVNIDAAAGHQGEVGFRGADPGPFSDGGPVNMQVGGEVDNADTNMEVANVPMGVVGDRDGAPAPFNGGTGVEDDLDMEVEAGSYILNAEAVQLVGVSDINAVIRDAYTIAARLGKDMPGDYDPQNKVPIRISNGEAVIPKTLVDIIGLDKLEKWNQKGLELRKQKEEFMAQQQQAQPPQGPQVAAEAPMQQQMGQLMDKGGKVEKEDNRDLATRIADFLGLGDIWRAGEITEKTLKQRVLDVFDPKNTPGFQDGGPPIPKRRPMSFWEKVAKEVKETPENLVKWFSGDNESEVPPRPIPNPNRVPPRPNFYNELYNQIRKHENSKPTVYEDEVKDKTGKVIKIVPTVGIGYNLNNPTALQDFKNIGADYNAVKKGEKALDENQIRKLYDISVQRAEDDVRKLVPIFNDLPDNIQKVLIDMSFNLGQTKLKDFTDMLEAVNNKDYKNMKKEMIKSNWYDQVGDRSKNLVKMVQKEFMPLPIPRPENLNKEAN